jgi:NTE family protein
MTVERMDGQGRIGLVMSGGGARGAYEAGVMSALAPALEARGECPNIYIGTSVGAINAAFYAAASHLGARDAGRVALEHWREVRKGRIVRPILWRQAPLTFLRYAGEILSLPGVQLPSLLDPKPFERQLARWVDWDMVHKNVDEQRVDSVAAVATASRSGRTVVFVEGHGERIHHRSHAIDYVRTQLDANHVRASAAIPILFPPVRIDRPREARGWYLDGGTRLNTPIKPALDLGADRLIVIATDSVAEPSIRYGRHESQPPDFGDGALHVLQGMLVDPVVEDMRMLGNINMFFAGRNGSGPAPDEPSMSAIRYREARGKIPYRVIPYMFIAPQRRGAIGRLATDVFRDRYGGIKGLRSPDFPFLNRLLGGDSPTHGELLSYLFFDEDFIEELIRMGRNDARRWLRSDPGPDQPWQIEPLDVFTRSSGRHVAA